MDIDSFCMVSGWERVACIVSFVKITGDLSDLHRAIITAIFTARLRYMTPDVLRCCLDLAMVKISMHCEPQLIWRLYGTRSSRAVSYSHTVYATPRALLHVLCHTELFLKACARRCCYYYRAKES